jgi:predicted ATP-dependent endonuclease of OLD family
MSGPLIKIEIHNFQGVASFVAEPNGQSMELRGDNAAGKSSVLNALCVSLGMRFDDGMIRNGEDAATTTVIIGEYVATRKLKRGGRPTLNIKLAATGTPLGSSPGLLKGFLEAIERNTFSTRKPADQAEILRKLCPAIDTSALDAEYDQRFAERTEINRDAKSFAAQAAGVKVPDAPKDVPPDIDLAEIAAKKADVERTRGMNAETRRLHEGNLKWHTQCQSEFEELRRKLAKAESELEDAQQRITTSTLRIALLVDPDATAIDAEIAAARETNRQRTLARQQQRDAERAKEERKKHQDAASKKERAAERITERLTAIKEEKVAQLAKAKLPIEGLAIDGDNVTLNGVEISALDNHPRMILDVAIGAKLGAKLLVLRDAILLNTKHRREIQAYADSCDVQTVSEVVIEGAELSAEIVEA